MTLERLEVTAFATVLREIVVPRRSGYLTVIRDQVRRTVYLTNGELALVTAATPQESFWQYLVYRGVIDETQRNAMGNPDPVETVVRAQAFTSVDADRRGSLLRDWTRALFVPLFSLDSGTAAFVEAPPLPPEQRVLIQSTASLILDGVRSISNGLVLRRSLGDLSGSIGRKSRPAISEDNLPLTDAEMKVAAAIDRPITIDALLKHFPGDTTLAAKVIVALLTLGVLEPVEVRQETAPRIDPSVEQDLALMAAIGASDPRALRAVALSRKISSIDFYEFLDLPRGAPTSRVVEQIERMKREYDPASFPPIVHDAIVTIQHALDNAMSTLAAGPARHEYDRLLTQGRHEGKLVGQEQARNSVARQNFEKAKELSILGDYYGAIVLLKQSVHFDPSRAEAWYLLGNCQERNPKWRRDAATSYQKALSADPNYLDAMLSLGDLYRGEGLAARAQSCYEDILKSEPDHAIAKSRLKELKAR